MTQEDGQTGTGSGDEESQEQAQQGSGEEESTQTGQGSGSAEDALKEARAESRKYRKRAQDAEKERDDLRSKLQSDDERQESKVTELQQQVSDQSATIKDLRVQVIAGRVGIVDPEAAARLLDWDEVEDPDDMKDVEKALKQLVKDRPYLRGNTSGGDGGEGGGPQEDATDMNQMLRRAAGYTS